MIYFLPEYLYHAWNLWLSNWRDDHFWFWRLLHTMLIHLSLGKFPNLLKWLHVPPAKTLTFQSFKAINRCLLTVLVSTQAKIKLVKINLIISTKLLLNWFIILQFFSKVFIWWGRLVTMNFPPFTNCLHWTFLTKVSKIKLSNTQLLDLRLALCASWEIYVGGIRRTKTK